MADTEGKDSLSDESITENGENMRILKKLTKMDYGNKILFSIAVGGLLSFFFGLYSVFTGFLAGLLIGVHVFVFSIIDWNSKNKTKFLIGVVVEGIVIMGIVPLFRSSIDIFSALIVGALIFYLWVKTHERDSSLLRIIETKH